MNIVEIVALAIACYYLSFVPLFFYFLYGITKDTCRNAWSNWRGRRKIEAIRAGRAIDFSLKRGDIVYSKNWDSGKGPLEVIDINWALQAAAVRLGLDPKHGIVVWPVAGLTKTKR